MYVIDTAADRNCARETVAGIAQPVQVDEDGRTASFQSLRTKRTRDSNEWNALK